MTTASLASTNLVTIDKTIGFCWVSRSDNVISLASHPIIYWIYFLSDFDYLVLLSKAIIISNNMRILCYSCAISVFQCCWRRFFITIIASLSLLSTFSYGFRRHWTQYNSETQHAVRHHRGITPLLFTTDCTHCTHCTSLHRYTILRYTNLLLVIPFLHCDPYSLFSSFSWFFSFWSLSLLSVTLFQPFLSTQTHCQTFCSILWPNISFNFLFGYTINC